MSTTIRRTALTAVLVIAILASALWFAFARDVDHPQGEETGVAVLPSDEGSDETQTGGSTRTAEGTTPAVTGELTEPEQVAVAFMDTYPGDVASLSDPTFPASLDGVDASLLEQVTDLSIEQVDHSVAETYERYAYTVSGNYEGRAVQVYTIALARPAEPAEGGVAAENELPYLVHSFDWAPEMLGDEEKPGPAAAVLAPIGAEGRGELMRQTRTDVIAQVLTADRDETAEQRQARLDELMVEPTSVTPPMSRSGRYAMKTEILSQAYTTERGGPMTITYTGTWVDPYDPTYYGSWSLTATITRDDVGAFIVQRVEETDPTASNRNDG